MPKSQRSAKRRHDEITSTSPVPLLAAPPNYASNIQMAEGEDSIDNILEEMAGHQGINLSSSAPSSSLSFPVASVPFTTNAIIPETVPVVMESTDTGDDTNDTAATVTGTLFDTTIPTRPYTKQELQRIKSWNTIMNTWQRTGTFFSNSTTATLGDGIPFVPSFDVEMTRHFKIQALSSYLLDTCKGLKMPAFERWYCVDNDVQWMLL